MSTPYKYKFGREIESPQEANLVPVTQADGTVIWELKATRRLKEILVQSKDQLLGELQSDILYMVDGDFAFGAGEHIVVPAGGLNIMGYSFDASRLGSYGVANHNLFISPAGGSGNIVIHNIAFTTTGTNAGVFNLTDIDGTHALEMVTVNFEGCKRIGTLNGYRQGTGITIGIYGCNDGITLAGQWTGFKLTNTNAFTFGATGTMFKRTSTTKFSNRLYLEVNVDLPTGAKLADFLPADFQFNELFQIANSLVKLNGTIDDANADLLVPNLTANNVKCLWRNNVGMPDTALEKFKETNIAGTYAINWLVDTFILNMTANTTFTEVNLPASGKNTEEIKIYLSGNFVPTFPAAWMVNMIGTYKKGEVNEITLKFLKTGLYFGKINNTLSVYPAPDISSIVPEAMLPQQTLEIILNGSFFTPATIVSVQGQTVNFVEFINSGQIKISVTSTDTEGDFDITISNGTSVTYTDILTIASGEVFKPVASEFTNITGTATFGDPEGTAFINNYNTESTAVWNRTIRMDKNWSLSFNHKVSPLGVISGNGGIHNVQLWRKNLGTQKANAFVQGDAHCIRLTVGSSHYRYSVSAIDTYKEEWRCIDGKISMYRNNVYLGIDANFLDDDLELRLRIRYHELANIKYIEYFDI